MVRIGMTTGVNANEFTDVNGRYDIRVIYWPKTIAIEQLPLIIAFTFLTAYHKHESSSVQFRAIHH